jgi:hypothetical protein
MRGLNRWEEDDGVHKRIVVIKAIQFIVVRLRSQAVHRQSCTACLVVPVSFRISIGARGIASVCAACHTRYQQGKLSKIPAIQRQLRNLAALNHSTGRRGSRVDNWSGIGDRHRRIYRTGIQMEVERLGLRDFQGQRLSD